MWLSIPPSGQLRGVNVHSSGHYFAQYYFCLLRLSIVLQEKLFSSLSVFLTLLPFLGTIYYGQNCQQIVTTVAVRAELEDWTKERLPAL